MKKQHKNQLSEKICKHCGSHFQTKYKSKQYCSDKCQNDAKCSRYYKSKKTTQVKRYETKREKLLTMSFGRWILKECQRAETVQVLQGHTVESLIELVELFKRRSEASGYENGKPTGAFELSHIWPVKSKRQDKMGLLHPQNLVLSPARLNRLHGSKCPVEGSEGIGLYLPTSALLDRYSVCKEDSLRVVERQVFKLLGPIWQQFVATLVIQKGQQELLRKKLEKTLKIKLPAHLTIEQLKEMADTFEITYFSANWEPKHESWVLEKELTRFGHIYGTEYGVYSSWLELCYLEIHGIGSGLLRGSTEAEEKELEQMLVGEAFAILHGQQMQPRNANPQDLLIRLVTPPSKRSETFNLVKVGDMKDAESKAEDFIF